MIEKLFGSTPAIMGDIISWLYLVAAIVVLTVIAFLLPKGATAKKVIGIILLVGTVALLVVPAIVNPALRAAIWNGGFTPYLLAVVALVLLYGLVWAKSKLAQALYGITVSIALPMGLLRILVPTWTNAKSIMDITSSTGSLLNLLFYLTLFFIAIWLVASGTYRLSVSSIWHIFYGFIIFGSVMVFTTEAGLSQSKTAIDMLKLFGTEGLIWKNVAEIALLCATGLAVVVLIGLIATLWRKYVSKSGEKVVASETKQAFVLRLIGKIVAVTASGAALIFMPNIMGAVITDFKYYSHVVDDMVGMPRALAFLAPILVMAVVMLVFEFLAEDHEIKVAQEKHAAENASAE